MTSAVEKSSKRSSSKQVSNGQSKQAAHVGAADIVEESADTVSGAKDAPEASSDPAHAAAPPDPAIKEEEPQDPYDPFAPEGRDDEIDVYDSELAHTDLAAFFGADGPLAQTMDGYEPRPSQVEMAHAVKQALLDQEIALVEAPTGTGKSLAYLLPAILSGKTVVVATANKSLQHQLYSKDIPFLRRVLGKEIKAVVVKGRSNYVCNLKLEKETGHQQTIALYDRADPQMEQLSEWLEETETGDVDDLPFTLNSDLRPRVVSFPDDCLHSDCRYFYDHCWVNHMRDRAAEAQIIITNHHLLLNALELGVAGERILPPAGVYVVDEAHQLEQTATSVFETVMSDYSVEQLLARSVYRDHVDEDELDGLRLQNTVAFQEASNLSRDNSFRVEDDLEQMRKLAHALRDLAQRLKTRNPYANPNGDLNMYESDDSQENGRRDSGQESQGENGNDEGEARRAYEQGIEGLNSAAEKLLTLATKAHDDQVVRYAVRVFDRRHVTLELHAAPINTADLLHDCLFHPADEDGALPRTVICTSATLATGGRFEHFKARGGIQQTGAELVLPAVFDYPTQALLYQPELPAYNYRQPHAYYDAVTQEIERLIEVSRGRTLCLFTSWSGLQQVSDRLQQPGRSVIWPLRAQGDAPRNALLDWFLATDHSVLLATRSFWEGVDIPGDDLSLVVMDKLPFPTPNDPLHSARMQALEEEGRSSFGEYMAPLMTLTLKQGFGRLIRRGADRGVVAILDERLTSKGYGRQARQDLPPAGFTRQFRDVHKFYQQEMESRADFALNVWATSASAQGLAVQGDAGAGQIRWRWQLLRLQDGKADEEDGLLHEGTVAAAEVQAMIAGLNNLHARIQKAGRSPGDFAVEVRCSMETAAYAVQTKPEGWQEARMSWRTLKFVLVDRRLPAAV